VDNSADIFWGTSLFRYFWVILLMCPFFKHNNNHLFLKETFSQSDQVIEIVKHLVTIS